MLHGYRMKNEVGPIKRDDRVGSAREQIRQDAVRKVTRVDVLGVDTM